jgi:multidrug resistance efflux pump
MATNAELRQRKLNHLDAEANAHLAGLRLETVMRGPTELELEAAKLKIARARLSVEEAQALSEADRIIAEQGVVVAQLRLKRSESDIERHEEELSNCTVKAPTAGRLAFVDVWKGSAQASPIRVGETVRWGFMIAKVADPGKMRARVVVNEVDALRLVPGMKATVGLTAYPGSRISGIVSRVGARAVDKNEKLGQLALRKAGKAGVNVVEVHVDLTERPEALRGGHTATVTIDLASQPDDADEAEPPVAPAEEGEPDA